MIHSIRAGRESSKVNLEVVEECEPSEKQNSEQKKPLPFDEVDEIVKQFYKNNKMLWMDSNSGWKYLQSKYSPRSARVSGANLQSPMLGHSH